MVVGFGVVTEVRPNSFLERSVYGPGYVGSLSSTWK